LTAAVIAGLIILSASGFVALWTVKSLGLTGNLAAQAVTYLLWHALFCLPQTLMPTLDVIFIAYGRTKTVLGLQITFSLILSVFIVWVSASAARRWRPGSVRGCGMRGAVPVVLAGRD